MKNPFLKKLVRPVVKEAKDAIVEELTTPTETKPLKTEIVEEPAWTKEEKLTVACVGLGLIAVILLFRRPSVKVYILKG